MKDIKRRSFLKSVFGGLTALLIGAPKAKANEVEVRFHSESPDDTATVEYYGFDGNGLGHKIQIGEISDAAFMEGDQWTDEQRRRMLEQHRRTMDKLCINAIKEHNAMKRYLNT